LNRRDAFDGIRKFRGKRFERRMSEFVANRADDCAGNAAHDMRFVAELFDFFEHGSLVFFGNFRFENDDHNFFYVARVITKKPQVTTCGLGCVFIERSLAQESLAKKIFAKPAGTKSKAAKIHAAKKVGKWKRHVKRALRSAAL
jgi:hypothetical protein